MGLGGLAGVCCGSVDQFGSSPGIADSMDYRDRGEHGDDPQDRGHAVEQGSDDDQHQALGAFHESYAAGTNETIRRGRGCS